MSRSPLKIRKQCELNKSDYEWFINTHHAEDDSNRTGLSNLLSMLLSKYHEICVNPADYNLSDISPNEIAKKAAEEVKEELSTTFGEVFEENVSKE